jgi:hypothetical protein
MCKIMSLDLYLNPYPKNNSNKIIGPEVRAKIMNNYSRK